MFNALKKHLLPSSTYETTSDVHLSTTSDPQITSNPQTQLELQLSAKDPETLTPQQQKAEQHKAKKKRNKQNRRERKQNEQQQDTEKRQQSRDDNVKPSDRQTKTQSEQRQDSKRRQHDSKDGTHSNRKNKVQDEQQQDGEKQHQIFDDDKHPNRKGKKQNELRQSSQKRHQNLDDKKGSHAPRMVTASRPEKDDGAKTLIKIKPGAASESNNVDESSKIAIKQKQGLNPGVAVDQNMAISRDEVKTKTAGKLSLGPPSNNQAKQVEGSPERLKQDIRSNIDLCETLNSTTRWATQAPVTAKRDAILWKNFESSRRAIAKTSEHSSSERTGHVCPDFPESLATLGYEDLVYGNRAFALSKRAHSTLRDLLWRTVIFANYFHDKARLEVGLPQGFQTMSPRQQILEVHLQDSKQMGVGRPSPSPRAAVEDAMLAFLSRTERKSPQDVKAFTFANSKMALQLHQALRERRTVKPQDLYEMFQMAYRKPTCDLDVDVVDLDVLFGSESKALMPSLE